MNQPDSVLVTGATGLVGSQVTLRLVRAGQIPFVMARGKAPGTAMLEALDRAGSVRFLRADISKPRLGLSLKNLATLAKRVGTIINCAGHYMLSADRAVLMETNVTGLRTLLDSAREWNRPVLHHVSSIAALGDRVGWVPEAPVSTPPRFRNAYEYSKWESERVAAQYASEGKVRVYRPGIIMGDSVTGETSKFDGPYQAFNVTRRWLPAFIGGAGDQHFPLVTVDLVADVLCAGIQLPPSGIEYVHVLDMDKPTLREFAEEMSARLLGHRKVFSIPCRALELIAAVPWFQSFTRIEPETIPYMKASWCFETTGLEKMCAEANINCHRLRYAYDAIAAFYALQRGRSFYSLNRI